MRNAGVSTCANEVKRSVRSALALVAICSSCVDIRILLLSVPGEQDDRHMSVHRVVLGGLRLR